MQNTRMSDRWGVVIAAIVTGLLISPSPSDAAVLVDSGQDGSSVGNLEPGGKAIGFTMGDTAFFLDSVQVRLRTGSTLPEAGDMTFAIYNSTTSGSIKPSTLAVTLTDPALVTSTTQSYTLTPESTFTLEANTTYWLVAFSDTTASNFGWAFDNPDSVTTTNGVTVPAGSGSNPPAGWFFAQNPASNDVNAPNTWTGTSSISNDAVIQGTVVPEPGALALLAAGGMMLLSCRGVRGGRSVHRRSGPAHAM